MECFECDAPATLTHHVVPVSLGGTRTIPLCEECHAKVHGLGMNIWELSRKANQRRRAQGLRTGEVPFGYRATRAGELLQDPGEQRTIRAVQDLRAQGMSQRTIVRELEPLGHVSRSGRPLGRSQIRRILAR